MNKFGKLIDGKIKYSPETRVKGRTLCVGLSAKEQFKLGEKKVVDNKQPSRCPRGFRYVSAGWAENEKLIFRKWKLERIPKKVYTYDDYDNAMEDYIREVRIDRGYTLREPSEYKGDPYPRFAQDAEDFILFRSQCMQYALPILNKYKETGEAPMMAEFKAGFPKIEWTYKEEL